MVARDSRCDPGRLLGCREGARARPGRGAEAAERVSAVAGRVRSGSWFKKIDSTLRGPIGAEIDALMRATGAATAIVCPAFPAQRRVVLDRVLLVGGVPVAETPIARDPQFPGGASSVIDLLRPQLDRALAWIPIDQLRAGGEALAARVRRLAGTAIIADAETDADLDALVEAAFAVTPAPLLVGSAGLESALDPVLHGDDVPHVRVSQQRWAEAAARPTSAGPDFGKRPIRSFQSAGLRFSKNSPVEGSTHAPAMKFLK